MPPNILQEVAVKAILEQKKYWELLAQKFDRFQTLRNNSQQHATTCNNNTITLFKEGSAITYNMQYHGNRVCKRTQHVTSNKVVSVCTGLN